MDKETQKLLFAGVGGVVVGFLVAGLWCHLGGCKGKKGCCPGEAPKKTA